jgi:hypothetical protein
MLNVKLLSSFKHNIFILRNKNNPLRIPAGIIDGDRIRYWDNYNIELIKRISKIKSQYG